MPVDLAGIPVLVTGAAGFIGFHCTQAFRRAGCTVHGLDNLSDYYSVDLKRARIATLETSGDFPFHLIDLKDHVAILALFAALRPRIVVHLAAQAGVRHSLKAPRAFTDANVDGFLGILEACRTFPVEHLIYASSSSVYGASATAPFREDDRADRPSSLYAATKRANELMARSYAHLYGVPCSGLRFFTVYGPWGRPDMAYFNFTKAILEGRPIDVYNAGAMRRDFTYVDDVTQAITRLALMPPAVSAPLLALPDADRAPHLIYNVGNSAPVDLADFIASIERAVGKTAVRRNLPMQPGDVPETSADTGRLATVTGFRPATQLDDGIDSFVQWYRTYHDS